jgi:diguanylate cyclase (GGDEF)-like protein/PAS domain S-box-containing protein
MTRPKELRVSRSSKRTAASVARRHRGRPSHVRGRALALEAAIASLYGVMLQIRDRNLLFHEACRILVQQGALPAASICVIEEHSGTLAAVASAGNAQEPARAGRGGPRPARFAAAFPLLCDGAPVAILRVQFPGAGALRPAAFDLLEKLAANLSIALDNIELERARSRVEEALRTSATRIEESQRFLGELINAVPAPISVKDSTHRYVAVNDAFCRLLGRRPEEILGREDAALVAPDIAARAVAMDDAALAAGRPVEYEASAVYQGRPHWLFVRKSALRRDDGSLVVVSVLTDLTDRKQAEARITHLATRDALTDLPNRVLLHDRLQQALASARRQGCTVAVLFIDLDRFKNINDSLGHDVGDRLLCEVAKRLSACLRETDTLARLGGDEFVAVVDGLKSAAEAGGVGDKILRALAVPFTVGEHALVSTASIGVSLFPADGENPAVLMRNADTAMYHAKASGRNRLQFFSADMNHRAVERHGIESALRGALQARQFRLHYQPQVGLASNRPTGAEALLRWQHPELGAVPPAKFIPIAEESGLIVSIGDWVLEQVCAQLALWSGVSDLRLSLNLSIGQLHDSVAFLDRAQAIIRGSGIDPTRLEFEITETLLASSVAEHGRVLRALGALGCTIAVDDFGTGYSSLSYLKRLPIDTVKIDRAFVRDIVSDPDDTAIVGAVVAMARKLKLEVVAEGVETAQQLEVLRELGCDRYQGFVFSPALPPEEFEEKFLPGASVPRER